MLACTLLATIVVLKYVLFCTSIWCDDNWCWTLPMQGGDEQEEANEQLAGALCALAERLLGTGEELDSVAAECQQLLNRAGHIFPDSPEPLQVTFPPCDCLLQNGPACSLRNRS